MTEESYRNSHLQKGDDYHQLFATNRHRAMMWKWERRSLDALMIAHLTGSAKHLDFACGTGRVLHHLSGKVASSTGVDVSASMLVVARQLVPQAEIIEADITRQKLLQDRVFDLITAFRFFPNAEAELRAEVIHVLAKHLAPDGILVFNNHLKRNSAAHIAERLIGFNRKRRMTPSEVEAMVATAGLEVIEIRRHGVLPMSERFAPLPAAALQAAENFFSGKKMMHSFAQNWIYVCRHRR